MANKRVRLVRSVKINGRSVQEQGRFGSHPSHDGFDESRPE